MKKNASKYKKMCGLYTVLLMLCVGTVACSSKESNQTKENRKDTEIETESMDTDREELRESNIKIQFPKEYKNTIEGVNFNLKVEVPDDFSQDMLFRSTAKEQIVDLDKAYNEFCSGKNIIEDIADEVEGEDGKKCSIRWYRMDNSESLSVINTNLTYSTSFFDNIYRAFQLEYNENHYSKDKEFDFESPQSVVEKIKETLNKLSITMEDFDYTYYALDHQTMQSQENSMYKDENGNEIEGLDGSKLVYKDQWTSEDDCYYFLFRQKYQGLPVYFGSNRVKEDIESDRSLQVLYSSKGIERIDLGLLTGLYQFEQADEKLILGDFETILQTVAVKYGQLLTDASYLVTRATLYQMPVKQKDITYKLRPAWYFEIKEIAKGENGEEQTSGKAFGMLVDAQTGEELNP